jgi:transposase
VNRPPHIEVKPEELRALIERAKAGALQPGDETIIQAMAETILYLNEAVEDKRASIARLVRMLFGASTEKAKNLLPDLPSPSGEESGNEPEKNPDPASSPSGEKRGHGRNGAAAYGGAERLRVDHKELKVKDLCPGCAKGKLYETTAPGVLLRVVGSAPIQAKVYELQKLRCNLCGEVFTAKPPEGVGEHKYDHSAGAMVALLKYGAGLPFNRLENLQGDLGIPLPASTQWEIVEKVADHIYPAYEEMVRQAAQGELFFNDDTTMKILSLINTQSEGDPSRKGVFTSAILANHDGHRISLFFTGRKHAGENMADLLQKRASGRDPPTQMCDALSRNVPQGFRIVLANCLVHARRNFIDAMAGFPEKCQHVLEALGKVYHHDATCKAQGMAPAERLRYHQANSAPIMKELKGWLQEQLEKKQVEPNSPMGKAVAYMLKHWEPLTQFLRVPGAPLDNNLCEQALKKAILHRKNANFFKTEHGAYVGDLFMSLIHTCKLNQVNPFLYLTMLQKHKSRLFKKPQNYMPWNYHLATHSEEV